jgi:hypothetical protein
MKKTLNILLMLLVHIACDKSKKSIADYESNIVKFAKSEFKSNNGDFSMVLPKNWFHNEDPIDSDTILYVLESGSKDSNFVAIGVMKMNIISGNIETEFKHLIKQMTKRANNIALVEMSEIKIGNNTAKTALLTYEYDGKITQEEIDCFIPINDTQYYYLGLLSDKNENLENNFGMMIECAKSFKLMR